MSHWPTGKDQVMHMQKTLQRHLKEWEPKPDAWVTGSSAAGQEGAHQEQVAPEGAQAAQAKEQEAQEAQEAVQAEEEQAQEAVQQAQVQHNVDTATFIEEFGIDPYVFLRALDRPGSAHQETRPHVDPGPQMIATAVQMDRCSAAVCPHQIPPVFAYACVCMCESTWAPACTSVNLSISIYLSVRIANTCTCITMLAVCTRAEQPGI